MKIHLWPCAAVGVLALAVLPCLAQERKTQPEKLPKLPEPVAAAPTVVEAQPGCGPTCYPPCDEHFDVLWMEYATPIAALGFRDITTKEKRKTMTIATREEDRKVSVYVMKSRPVKRECPCTRMVEVTKTDCNGHCYTSLCPTTEMRVEEDTEYYAVLEEQTIKVKVPYLQETTVEVPRVTTVFEYHPEVRTKEYIMKIPAKPFPPEQIIFPPKLACEGPMEMLCAPGCGAASVTGAK